MDDLTSPHSGEPKDIYDFDESPLKKIPFLIISDKREKLKIW
jgi:hypothetical protein